MGVFTPAARILAVLGPTNTGKTHLAIERMLGHRTGMIGFPLRLLARENYDRVVALKGARAVALITGEEKIVPPHPVYWICTVESMPLDLPVDFLAVDEIQLCGDAERGHVFTNRLLHARGISETMFLGADTIRPLLKRLVPEAEYVSRPRFSTLSYTGPKKITRLPPRSAVVAFAVADVFALAELMRRQRGGTAVVMGALSPRARNAQVGLFQSGEVDYLVATDAIGMGLNMDLDHVAFARLAKFDGRGPRRLAPAEIAQIAGRAGRHMSDGTFGTTGDLPGIDEEIVEAVENHRFDPLPRLYWRNARLDYRSVGGLLKSLEEKPHLPGLIPAREADDHLALAALAKLSDIAAAATNPAAVRLLWEVCQIPDFRKIMSDTHARFLASIYGHLIGRSGRLPIDFVAAQMSRLDRSDGDIDTLMTRIAHIRTWTYIAHRSDWLTDATSWQEKARAIEDHLSDALHDRITQRFVDRRSAFLVKQLSSSRELLASVSRAGEVKVEGHPVGRLDGFRFVPDAVPNTEASKTLLAAANRVLRGEIEARVSELAAAPDDEFALGPDGKLLWRGGVVGRLIAGESVLDPQIEVFAGHSLDSPLRETIRRRLASFWGMEKRRSLASLVRLRHAEFDGAARGLVYQLCEALGVLPASAVAAQCAGLSGKDRKLLAKHGVRLGTETVYLDGMLKREAMTGAALLWSIHGKLDMPKLPGGVAAPRDRAISSDAYRALGYRVLGPRILRVDKVEGLAAAARRLARQGAFGVTPELLGLASASRHDLAAMLTDLGYRAVRDESGVVFHARPAKRYVAAADRPRADSPFAKLAALTFAR
ncbi:MAG TPA: helicase-related protein [Stellaceae bacterium]